MAYTAQPANLIVGGLTVTITRPSGAPYNGTGTADDSGALVDGCKLTPSYTVYSPDIEQDNYPQIYRYTAKQFKISLTYGEPTLGNLKNAWDISNAIITGPPKTLNFGTNFFTDLIPAPLVVAVTMFSPGAATATTLRTITFNKVFTDTPGEMTITKKAIAMIPCTFNAAFDAASSRVGQFSDLLT